MNLFDTYREMYVKGREEEMSLVDYLELCKRDPLAYASAHGSWADPKDLLIQLRLAEVAKENKSCLLYTSPSPRD